MRPFHFQHDQARNLIEKSGHQGCWNTSSVLYATVPCNPAYLCTVGARGNLPGRCGSSTRRQHAPLFFHRLQPGDDGHSPRSACKTVALRRSRGWKRSRGGHHIWTSCARVGRSFTLDDKTRQPGWNRAECCSHRQGPCVALVLGWVEPRQRATCG